MKPTAYKIIFAGGNAIFSKDNYGGKETIPLYTAHEIAEFVRKLYFDEDFLPENPYAGIADKIEEEAK